MTDKRKDLPEEKESIEQVQESENKANELKATLESTELWKEFILKLDWTVKKWQQFIKRLDDVIKDDKELEEEKDPRYRIWTALNQISEVIKLAKSLLKNDMEDLVKTKLENNIMLLEEILESLETNKKYAKWEETKTSWIWATKWYRWRTALSNSITSRTVREQCR